MINAEMFHFFLSASLFPWAGITFLDSDRELSSQGTPTLRPQSLTINPIPPPDILVDMSKLRQVRYPLSYPASRNEPLDCGNRPYPLHCGVGSLPS